MRLRECEATKMKMDIYDILIVIFLVSVNTMIILYAIGDVEYKLQDVQYTVERIETKLDIGVYKIDD